ncbi:hypothetical protein LY76DRAFT_602261 [Colletotrichum caudatum]|nr:hypothetical protein LY76DRAFT_602261 [Colletotrichum caudatum]
MKHEAIWKRDGILPAADASGFSFARSYLEVTNRTTKKRRSGDRLQYGTSVYLSMSERTSCLGNRLVRLPTVPGYSLSNWRHREPFAYGGEPLDTGLFLARREAMVLQQSITQKGAHHSFNGLKPYHAANPATEVALTDCYSGTLWSYDHYAVKLYL